MIETSEKHTRDYPILRFDPPKVQPGLILRKVQPDISTSNPDSYGISVNLSLAFEHDNETQPRSALKYRSPGKFPRLAVLST